MYDEQDAEVDNQNKALINIKTKWPASFVTLKNIFVLRRSY